MGTIGSLLVAVGGILALVGGIWMLVLAFQESILWGLGSLFIPFVIFFFVATRWDKARKPFLIWLAGFVPAIIGTVLAGGGQA